MRLNWSPETTVELNGVDITGFVEDTEYRRHVVAAALAVWVEGFRIRRRARLSRMRAAYRRKHR